MSASTNPGSFAQRAAAMPISVENWDDDLDFQGDLFTHSVSTVQTSLSSRVSARSESVAGDEDWQLSLTPDDERSTQNAISSAKDAGIPIPNGIPSSALLGGSIKRLGKKKSTPKVKADDDWGDDLDLPAQMGALTLKTPQLPQTPALEQDDLDDWGEGSLGIRNAGKRTGGNRSSSLSAAMSPSLGSCVTMESEEDDFNGLVLPDEPLDFSAKLSKLKAKEHDVQSPQPETPENSQAAPQDPHTSPKPSEETEDFLDGLDIGESLDTKKRTVNRNLKVQTSRAHTPHPRPATTLTFTDKPTSSRIPRPLPSSAKAHKLDPVYESGASQAPRMRAAPTTRHDQLLRLKRSAPLLRGSTISNPSLRHPMPFLPGGNSRAQSHHVNAKASSHLRRESDPSRAQSPTFRTLSRLSNGGNPETPSRSTPSRTGLRKDVAPAALAREAASKRLFTKPSKKRNFGDGSELDVFDDLPTSATKEKSYVKTPSNRTPAAKGLRRTTSISRLPMPDRNQTPAPPATPRSPTKQMEFSTPRFARDTAASRNAREQRLAGTRSRAEGSVSTTHTNWKAQVAARSPHNSPVQKRKGNGQKPQLIKPMSTPMVKNEKGMTYNPILHRWEGNETALGPFHHPNPSTSTLASINMGPVLGTSALLQQGTMNLTPPSLFPARRTSPVSHSPPRPALISHMSTTRNQVQVERGMVFDPLRMKWLKISSHRPSDASNPDFSPSGDEEEDPFAGLDDLKDDTPQPHATKTSLGAGELQPAVEDTAFVGEEFDLGPEFIRRQTEEEKIWKKRTEAWVGGQRDILGNSWRWAVRDLARLAAEAADNQEASRLVHFTEEGGSGSGQAPVRGLRRVESFR